MKYRYKGDSNFLILKGTIIEGVPTTMWSGIQKEQIKVLYYKDENGKEFPIHVNKFELL